MLDIALDAAPAWEDGTDWPARAHGATRAALALTPHAGLIGADATVQISIRLGSDAQVQALNARWRGKDRPTNILSFPMLQSELIGTAASAEAGEILLGDLILAYETCVREAAGKGVALADHVAHLLAHGTLHLLGYDHENDAEAEAMEALETRALASLGLADPYGDRAGAARPADH